MEYGIRELAEMAGVSARTLRWYDRIGLLRPCRVSESGYRFYSRREVDRLQMILFYRALGVELKTIGALLDEPSFDRLAALRGHLEALEDRRARMDGMIASLRRVILAEERKETMMDHEKFEAFKRASVTENEGKYGAEARGKYGDAAVDATNRRMMNMTVEEYDQWQALGDEICARLEAAVTAGAEPCSQEGQAVAQLHRRWLCFQWEKYTPQMHMGVAEMYVADERFTRYYDSAVPGCARFLRDAVHAWLT